MYELLIPACDCGFKQVIVKDKIPACGHCYEPYKPSGEVSFLHDDHGLIITERREGEPLKAIPERVSKEIIGQWDRIAAEREVFAKEEEARMEARKASRFDEALQRIQE